MDVPGKKTNTNDELATLDKICELCKVDNTNAQASGCCKECEQYMCKTCFEQHIKLTLCRHHTLLDTKASSGICFRSNQNENFKKVMRQLEKQICETKEVEKKIQENKKDNKMMFEKALRDIKQLRRDINKYLDKVETDITCQVKNVMEENDALLIKLETECSSLSIKLEEIKKMLNSELYKDDVLFIHTVESKPRLPESEKAISIMKSKSTKKYEFICDEELRSLETSSRKLGILAISTSSVSPPSTEGVKEKVATSSIDVTGKVTETTEKKEGDVAKEQQYEPRSRLLPKQSPLPKASSRSDFTAKDSEEKKIKATAYQHYKSIPGMFSLESRMPKASNRPDFTAKDSEEKKAAAYQHYESIPGMFSLENELLKPPSRTDATAKHTEEDKAAGQDSLAIASLSWLNSLSQKKQSELKERQRTMMRAERNRAASHFGNLLVSAETQSESKFKVGQLPSSRSESNVYQGKLSKIEDELEPSLCPEGVNSSVAVGSIVTHNLLSDNLGPGIVTAVHRYIEVNVKWEDGNEGRHRVGVGEEDVTII